MHQTIQLKTVTPLFIIVLGCIWLGFLSKAQAVSPPPDGAYGPPAYGEGNTAEGQDALLELTTGTFNTAVGLTSLQSNTVGNLNTAVGAGALVLNDADHNTAIGAGALLFNTTGSDNTASGFFALFSNLTGTNNTANGAGALASNTTGSFNTATGNDALLENTTGSNNTATGNDALSNNTTGDNNTAIGEGALFSNTTGIENTAVGQGALGNLTDGIRNIAIGSGAGAFYTRQRNNICIGNQTAGILYDEDAIRIGDHLTTGGIVVLKQLIPHFNEIVRIGSQLDHGGISVTQILGRGTIQIGNGLAFPTEPGRATCNIGGIYGQAFGPSDMPVHIGSDNKLGTVVSSRRFKHDIKPIDNASEAVLALKPVSFRYNSDTTNTPRVGLIAEDVAQVSPELVIPDKEGKPLSVRYEDVNVMLLNEFLKEHRKVEQLKNDFHVTVAQQQKQIETLTAQLKEQATQIQKVSAQVEVNKPAPQTVLNSRQSSP